MQLDPQLETYLHQNADGTSHSNCTHANHTDLIVGMAMLVLVDIVDELILERHGALQKGKQQIISPVLRGFVDTGIFVSSRYTLLTDAKKMTINHNKKIKN